MPEINELFLTTALIKCLKNNEVIRFGTSFFYTNQKGDLFLITNKHLIYPDSGIEHRKSDIDEISIRLHVDRANLRKNEDIKFSLFSENNPQWLEHHDKTIDIILIPLKIDRTKHIIVPIGKDAIEKIKDIEIDLFEKIFILGYPYGFYDDVNNLPITRVGHMSSQFDVGYAGKPYRLADIETHPGMSGSPVFMKIKDYIKKDKSMNLGNWIIILAGIFSGQPIWKLDNGAKIGHSLSVVWFPEIIFEILDINNLGH